MKDWKDILYQSLEDKSIPQWILDIDNKLKTKNNNYGNNKKVYQNKETKV